MKLGFPIWEPFAAELDQLALEPIRPVFGTIVDQVIAFVQVLVVGKDGPFIGHLTQIPFDPVQFVV